MPKSKNLVVTMTRDPDLKKFKTFNVTTEKTLHGEKQYLEIVNEDLCNCLRNWIQDDTLYNTTPKVSLDTASNWLDALRSRQRKDRDNLSSELFNYLVLVNQDLLGKVEKLKNDGKISFSLLSHLFPAQSFIEINRNEVQGGTVTSTRYSRSFFGAFFEIEYNYITTNGTNFVLQSDSVRISEFDGLVDIMSLYVRPLSNQRRAELTKRGTTYASVALGSHYMGYQGHMEIHKWWRWESLRATGRIMLDDHTFYQFTDNSRDSEGTIIESLNENQYCITHAYINGFSFSTKQWGRFAVSNISPIEFNSHAFDQLVLPDDKKQLVKALVTNGNSGFQDIIGGKGGGCIFLLHGEPGVGKTLTAEAIAEHLRRPLYSVSVGELGVNPNELEASLRRILDVAHVWNAVILIDEADIFLEKRTGGDILRNAMVGIFLRLLEYHSGVLFLTTNRVREFDEAFHSRISIALRYAKLDRAAREKIWTNLLSAAGITGLNPTELAKFDINGRQIKTTIRLALGLAQQEGVAVSAEHVKATLAVSQQFKRDLKK
jgi:hypothetical protein